MVPGSNWRPRLAHTLALAEEIAAPRLFHRNGAASRRRERAARAGSDSGRRERAAREGGASRRESGRSERAARASGPRGRRGARGRRHGRRERAARADGASGRREEAARREGGASGGRERTAVSGVRHPPSSNFYRCTPTSHRWLPRSRGLDDPPPLLHFLSLLSRLLPRVSFVLNPRVRPTEPHSS